MLFWRADRRPAYTSFLQIKEYAVKASGLAVLCLIVSIAAIAQDHPTPPPSTNDKPRVFITDSQSWEMSGSGGGSNGSWGAHSQGGARPQTAEIIKTFGERCSAVMVNNKQDIADYIVLLDHEGGKGVLRHQDKVAVFQKVSGDVVIEPLHVVAGRLSSGCMRRNRQRLVSPRSADSRRCRQAARSHSTGCSRCRSAEQEHVCP